MTLQQLQYIKALDLERNFVRASERCFVTQPSLTMQVRKLEDQLGVKIFDRSRKPLVPTPIGVEIIEQAKVILKEAERMKEIIEDHKGELAGELVIGIIPTLAPYLLPLFIHQFQSDYPGIRLVVRELQTDSIVEKLRSDELHLGILVTPLNEKRITETPLFHEPLLAYVGKHHRLWSKDVVALSDLDLEDTWLLSEGHCFRGQVLNICKARKTDDAQNLVFESGSLETLERLVERHKGMTILPYLATLDLDKEQQLLIRPFKGSVPVREVSIVTNRVHVRSAMIEALQLTIHKCLPESLKSIEGDPVPL